VNPSGFYAMPDAVYRIAAQDGRLDILSESGTVIWPANTMVGRAVAVSPSGQFSFRYQTGSRTFCFGTEAEFVFDFDVSLQPNGFGTARVRWTYGANTFCTVCDQPDSATLRRITGP